MEIQHVIIILVCPGFPPQTSPSHIKIGDKVRVKPTVMTPKYKWGSVTHRSVGVVKGMSALVLKSMRRFIL